MKKKLEVGEKVYLKIGGRYAEEEYKVTEIARLTKTLAITKEGDRFRNNPSNGGGFRQYEARVAWECTTYLYRYTEEAKIKIDRANEIVRLKKWWFSFKQSIKTVSDIEALYKKLNP